MASKRIMVVEDESIIATHLGSVLEAFGYEVPTIVSSGPEAIARASVTHHDLALMDVGLIGGMDGIETANEIWHRFNVPVVYLTAHASQDVLGRAKMTDPFGYIVKPFGEKELRAVIEMAIHKYETDVQREIINSLQNGLTIQRVEQHSTTGIDEPPNGTLLPEPALEQLSPAKEELLSAVSHELKQPLTSIMGFVETILIDHNAGFPLDERVQSYLESVQTNSHRMKALLDNLLATPLLESRGVELKLEGLDAEEDIKQTLDAMRPQIE